MFYGTLSISVTTVITGNLHLDGLLLASGASLQIIGLFLVSPFTQIPYIVSFHMLGYNVNRDNGISCPSVFCCSGNYAFDIYSACSSSFKWTTKVGGCVTAHFVAPAQICRRRQIVPTLAAHFVASMHNLTPGDKMCRVSLHILSSLI